MDAKTKEGDTTNTMETNSAMSATSAMNQKGTKAGDTTTTTTTTTTATTATVTTSAARTSDVRLIPHVRPLRHRAFNSTLSVPAFVVNVHNALNFDLDLEHIPNSLLRGIAHERYTYVTREKDRNDLYRHVDGRAYRCRIQHLSKVHGCPPDKFRFALRRIMRRIDALNGWVVVHPVLHMPSQRLTLDRFGRVLVDLFDPHTGESLGEWMRDAFPGVIQTYSYPDQRH